MQTKHLCVLIHIWTKSEVGAPLNQFKPSSKIFLLTVRSKVVLLLSIIYVISVLFCYAFMHVCLLMPCGHLLGKGWPLGPRLWCLIVTLSLSYWYPGSGVVLDCMDSWSLPSFLLSLAQNIFRPIKGIRMTNYLLNPGLCIRVHNYHPKHMLLVLKRIV